MWSVVQSGSVGCQGAPSSRSKHAVCGTQSGIIYLLGGRSANLPLKDFWRFDPVQSLWEEMRCRGNRPPCLQEHTMVAWRHMLYVFGGEIGFASTGETPLWILDIGTSAWRKHHIRGINGQQPSGRRGHTAVVYNGAMHIYGGYQDLRGSSSELWSFDFLTERWHLTMVSQLEQPPARHNHTAVVHDGSMWVFGGMTDLQERGDFWRWDFGFGVKQASPISCYTVAKQWHRIRSQKGPGELHGHCAVKAMACMYIFGGERAGVLLNELWRYHFATETWERLQPIGVIPNPRCRHASVAEPSLHVWDDKINAWDSSPQQTATTNTNTGRSHRHRHHRAPPSTTPPKSASMCFVQPITEPPENGRKYFKFRVHPVSRLCSKSTSSDDEDDDPEYVASYNHNSAQVNISKSLRDKITSSRLVRSISSGSYSILHNPGVECHTDELERLVEETPPHQHRTIQKSQSSDAVLESDSETSTPQHTSRPKPDRLPSPANGKNSLIHPPSSNNGNSCKTPDGQKDKTPNGDWCCCYHGSSNSLRMMGHTHCDVCHRMVPQSGGTRGGRLAYDGPLTTVKDVEEETSEGGDEPQLTVPKSIDAVLVDLDTTYPMETERSRQHPSSYTLSDLVTPSVESCGLSHSVSHSSGYHSFTDDEGGDYHREFAGCLNATSRRPSTRGCRGTDGMPFELKTFHPNQQSEPPRARSWDRSSQRKQVRSHPVTPTTPSSTTLRLEHQMASVSPGRRWHISPSKPRIEQRHWQLCLYVFGGREQGAPGVYRQPIAVWKLYV